MPEPLFPYQEFGAHWLASKPHAFLADEMRVGKTAQAIRACDLVKAERILVLCPAIARMNWGREFDKFLLTPRIVTVVLTGGLTHNWAKCVICSYDLATKNSVGLALRSVNWDVVILDEAHYCKNHRAKRTKLVQSLRTRFSWLLSGTPAPNHAGELYPHLHRAQLFPGSYWEFRDQFCATRDTPFGTIITGSKNIPQLKALIAPYFLRRRLAEVVKNLPPMLFSDVVVEATPPDMSVWFPTVALKIDTAEEILAKIDKENQAIESILNLTGKGGAGSEALEALQSAQTTTSRRWVALQKVPNFCKLITEELNANAYAKIVIYAWHRDAIRYCHMLLKQYNPQMIYGGTPTMQRDIAVRKFTQHGQVRVFIGQIQAAGVAIDLSMSHEVAFLEASWVPGENAQAAMRVHHLKQTHPVNIRFFSLADSVDERVQAILRRKTRDLTALFDEPATVSDPVANPFG